MQTSCPACRTTFRVSQAQLGLRRGLVRCGHCNAVFNAYDTLLPELESAPATPQADEPLAVLGEAPEEATLADIQAAYAEAGIALTTAQGAAVQVYQDTAALETAPEPAPDQAAGGEAEESAEAILLSDLPTRRPASAQRPKWKTALYLLFALLLTLSLLGQLVYFLRVEIASAVPGARPVLRAFCKPLGCDVPLPRQLGRQAIVSSSLEHDAEQKSRVRLSFLLANRTSQTQAWPHVVLTLIDVREAPVAQKAFAPEVYLPRGVSVRAGFPAQSEQEAGVDLDIGSLAASSYVITLAYP